jgi:hypothetical protein
MNAPAHKSHHNIHNNFKVPHHGHHTSLNLIPMFTIFFAESSKVDMNCNILHRHEKLWPEIKITMSIMDQNMSAATVQCSINHLQSYRG